MQYITNKSVQLRTLFFCFIYFNFIKICLYINAVLLNFNSQFSWRIAKNPFKSDTKLDTF